MSGAGERSSIAWNGTGDMPAALAKAHQKSVNPPEQPSSSGITIVYNDDGSISFERSAAPAIRRNYSARFDENMALHMDEGALSTLAHDLLDGIEADKMSRSGFLANYNKGIDLLGTKIEDGTSARGSRQSISRVKNPALLKACMRSQSLARGQILPADGPVKVQTISGSSAAEDQLARDFEQDYNYYLTDVATEYYPDTDRALFYRAFGGSMYKKVHRCPLRRRPVSESVPLEFFIVNEDATDHHGSRKTHESILTPATTKRMQRLGDWRDVDLSTPQINDNPARRKILEQMGLSAIRPRPQDTEYTMYETYVMLDPADYGFDDRFADAGMPVPYRVTMERDSKQVLAIHRNWRDKDELFREKRVFVKYGLVPGLGFLDYGYLHLIGNQTRVLTALWQILIDNGMLKNFPAGMKVRGIRTLTNEINPGLGEWTEVDIGSMKSIKDAFMGMPYGDVGAWIIDLLRDLTQDVEKMSGTLEIEVGNNRTNMPVGTILAMIEQQAQDLTAVHQRDHRAQKEELRLIRDCFLDHPDDLRWMQRRGGSGREWQALVEEFANMDLVPASDPNVPSQAHRIMIGQFLMQLAQGAPMLFGSKIRDVAKRVMVSAGIRDADAILASPQEIAQAQQAQQQQGQGGGSGGAAVAKAQLELPLKQRELAIEESRLALEQQENQREAANQAAEHTQRDEDQAAKANKDQLDSDLALARLRSEHVRDLADTVLGNQPQAADPSDAADLKLTEARAFAAMGQGAQAFANADQTVQQGEQELAGLDEGLPKKPTQRTNRRRKPSGGGR